MNDIVRKIKELKAQDYQDSPAMTDDPKTCFRDGFSVAQGKVLEVLENSDALLAAERVQRAMAELFDLPNVDNRIGEWKDVNDAWKKLRKAWQR